MSTHSIKQNIDKIISIMERNSIKTLIFRRQEYDLVLATIAAFICKYLLKIILVIFCLCTPKIHFKPKLSETAKEIPVSNGHFLINYTIDL